MTPDVSSVVLLWHGSGAGEGDVMRPLASALGRDGRGVLIIDWDAGDDEHGRGTLLDSLADARGTAADLDAPLVVAGWSLGGTAAISLAAASSTMPPVDAVIGLAVDFTAASPLNEALLTDVASLARPVQLVHGRRDQVIPAAFAVNFAETHAGCELHVVDTDRAGVTGAEWNPTVGRCLPSNAKAVQLGLEAAVAAVARALHR